MMLQQNSQGIPNWAWKMIWRTKVPVKAAFLGWLAAIDACLTQNKLQRRGFSLSSRCYLSNSEEETVEHLFLHCRVSRQCWEHFLSITGISLVIPQKICNLLEIWQSQGVKGSLKQIWRTIPICILWTIWLERNKASLRERGYRFPELKTNALKSCTSGVIVVI